MKTQAFIRSGDLIKQQEIKILQVIQEEDGGEGLIHANPDANVHSAAAEWTLALQKDADEREQRGFHGRVEGQEPPTLEAAPLRSQLPPRPQARPLRRRSASGDR